MTRGAKVEAGPWRIAGICLLVGLAIVLAETVFLAGISSHQHRSPWGIWYVPVISFLGGCAGAAPAVLRARRRQRSGAAASAKPAHNDES